MQLRERKYLVDIQQACEALGEFVHGKTWADYGADKMLRSAVERQFEIIGEALSQLMKLDPTFAVGITDVRRIIAFRNLLIHNYWTVSNEIVWGILQKDLPVLRREVETRLTARESGSGGPARAPDEPTPSGPDNS